MMTPLRRRMLEDLKRHNLAERTQQSYLSFMARLARHFGVSPDHLTRDQLETSTGDARATQRWAFLAELPRNHRDGNMLFVHGSPRNPLNEYVFPEDIHNVKKFEKLFSLIQGYSMSPHQVVRPWQAHSP